MTSQSTQEVKDHAYSGIDVERASAALRRASIVARRQALETFAEVMLYRDCEMVRETDPERIFHEGVEAKICECGRVLVKDSLDPLTEEFLKNPKLENYK